MDEIISLLPSKIQIILKNSNYSNFLTFSHQCGMSISKIVQLLGRGKWKLTSGLGCWREEAGLQSQRISTKRCHFLNLRGASLSHSPNRRPNGRGCDSKGSWDWSVYYTLRHFRRKNTSSTTSSSTHYNRNCNSACFFYLFFCYSNTLHII